MTAGGRDRSKDDNDDAVVLESSSDSVKCPQSMAEALEWDDPVYALQLLSQVTQQQALEQANALQTKVHSFQCKVPDALYTSSTSTTASTTAVDAATACADSIVQSLSKIASGGSQASQEIRKLEQGKHALEQHAEAVETAHLFRQCADQALQALQTKDFQTAAYAVQPWLEWKQEKDDFSSSTIPTAAQMTQAYAGEYCLKQLATAYERLKENLLEEFQHAVVEQGDLQQLGHLTPLLSVVQLEPHAVRLYLQYLQPLLQAEMAPKHSTDDGTDNPQPVFLPMAPIYNAAVHGLRHHLPLVSHCLYKADGDAAVVQLVHTLVEQALLPLLDHYQDEKQWRSVQRRANQIYGWLVERYTGRRPSSFEGESSYDTSSGADPDADDGGFSTAIGTLSDVDSAMEEAARCIQHAESYLRFVQHTCQQVNQARQLRWNQQHELQLQQERLEQSTSDSKTKDDDDDKANKNTKETEFCPLQILSPQTPLHLAISELGNQYASVERCLLLASMQRALETSPEADPRYYRPLSSHQSRNNTQTLQTSVVQACWYATKHGTQRALATGHTATARTVVQYTAEVLNEVLLEVLAQRAEEHGVTALKPGDGLLVGSTGLFHHAASINLNMMRHHGTSGGGGGSSAGGGAGASGSHEPRHEQQLLPVAHVCANLNDLHASVQHSQQLEQLLEQAVHKGYAADTAQELLQSVRQLEHVTTSFQVAADSAMESLESVLKPRLRAIVGQAVGTTESASSTAASFMGGASSLAGMASHTAQHGHTGHTGHTSNPHAVADSKTGSMQYLLDEEAYNLLQVSEGYVARLCTLLDELLEPLRQCLVPPLWDTLFLRVMGTVSKRLETAHLRKCEFTALGGLALDSHVRDLIAFTKDRLYSPEYSSNTGTVTKACLPLSRLLQIARLLSVDDLDDVLDLIGSAKRKGSWDLKLEEAKAFLSARVEFESAKVNELLRLPEED